MPDGTHLEARANPRPTGGFVITYTDITERVQVREAMRVAKEEAELSDRSKSEFLANMSHELRTPLNAIIGFSQVLQDELKGPLGDPSYQQYVRDIHESGTLLLSLINDILDLSKIEAGKLELQDAKQNVPEIVGACRRIIEGRAKDAGLLLDTRLSDGLPHLQVDERALKQILLNLLSNAVKFTPEGGSIAVDARIDDDGCFAILVSDTGIGIAPAEIPNALSNFGQVENYLTREEQGTGLGLPLAKSLAEAHGGTLELESELGRGTTVTIRFPAERIIAGGTPTVRRREAGAA
jgi:two-component system cell cycle sensor histidine kinase PleC